MNPDLFLINTDYLTLAKNNQKTLSITIPQTTMGPSDITAEGSVDIPIDTVRGAIPVIWARYIVGSNKSNWVQVGTQSFSFFDYGNQPTTYSTTFPLSETVGNSVTMPKVILEPLTSKSEYDVAVGDTVSGPDGVIGEVTDVDFNVIVVKTISAGASGDILFWRIRFERTNDTTMRLKWVCLSMNHTHGVTIPAIQLELSITTFYPPNVS